jgi:hypothetical protein
VFETDASGAIVYWVTFDEDNLEAALSELEARHRACKDDR